MKTKEQQKKYWQKYNKYYRENKDEFRRQNKIKNGFKYVFDSPIDNLKKCTRCKKYQSLENYGKHKNIGNGGRRARCKKCRFEQALQRRRKKTPEQRRKGYIVYRKRIEVITRPALKNLFEGPINELMKCRTCKQYKPPAMFYKSVLSQQGYIKQCKACCYKYKLRRHIEKHGKPPRASLPPGEAEKRKKIHYFLIWYLAGGGCCFYCGEINPFMLNNHHIFGRENSDFTITLCEIHHAPFTRGIPFVLQDWH